MKIAYFLLPLLLVGIGGTQAFAYPGEILQTTDQGVIGRISNSMVLDADGHYRDFILSQNSTSFKMETVSGTVTLNKITCEFSLSKNSAVLFSDSISALNSIQSSNVWNKVNSVNNAACTAYYDEATHALVAKKYSAGVGLLEYKYIYDPLNFKWKTQLEATNLTSLTNRVFGFDETINLKRDTISWGDGLKNLDNFNGTTFDRAWIVTHQAKMIDLLNNFNYDFDLAFDYLDSVTVYDTGYLSTQLVFHFTNSNSLLLPNQKLVLDPTISQLTTDAGFAICANCTGAGQGTSGGLRLGSGSALDHLRILNMSLYLKKGGTPTGTAYVEIRNSANVTQFTLGTIDPSTLTTSNAFYSFYNPIGYYLAVGDRIQLRYTNTNFANYVSVAYKTTDVYDTTKTFLTHYDHGYTDETGKDLTFVLTYTTIPPPNKVTDLTSTSIGVTTADLAWTAPSAGGGGQTIIGYQVNVTTPQTSNPLVYVNNTGSSTPSYTVTGLVGNTSYSARVSAMTNVTGGHPLLNATGNVYNFTTLALPAGSLSITSGNVGDTLKLAPTITMSSGSSPLMATDVNVYKDNSLVQTTSINETLTVGVPTALDNIWYRITTSTSSQYAVEVTVTNGGGSTDIMSGSNATVTREYDPDYLPAVDNPSTQGNVNATVTRYNDEDGILLKVNRIGVAGGDTWQIECITQTNTQASQTKNQSLTWVGTWSNTTDTGYFNTTWTGFANSHAYITCFNDDELFTLTSFTNSSLALLGIQLFDESYGSMLGVPVGVFFLVMTAGMANKRTAPTWIIVLAGIAGTMATIGFFSFEPIVWGLALVTAMLGIFVNQKIF